MNSGVSGSLIPKRNKKMKRVIFEPFVIQMNIPLFNIKKKRYNECDYPDFILVKKRYLPDQNHQ